MRHQASTDSGCLASRQDYWPGCWLVKDMWQGSQGWSKVSRSAGYLAEGEPFSLADERLTPTATGSTDSRPRAEVRCQRAASQQTKGGTDSRPQYASGRSPESDAAEQPCAGGVFGLARRPLDPSAGSGGNGFLGLGLGFIADQRRRALCSPQALLDSGSQTVGAVAVFL